MINPISFIKFLKFNGIDFFSGVPDSVLKNFTNCLSSNNKKHLIAANEGNAIGLGIGYYLSTNKLACVYMQNSGLGNAINPLISVAHKSVYSIPMILIIGWRGAPGIKDEPQHQTKGRITTDILRLLDIKFLKISKKPNFEKMKKLINFSKEKKKPVALLVKQNSFLNKKLYKLTNTNQISREEAINTILKNLSSDTKLISSTGYISREVLKCGYLKKKNFKNVFYMVGGMGHSSSVSLGVALKSKKKIVCLDGDGSLLMHFGSLLNIAKLKKRNLKYILLNNGSHQSVGGQETGAFDINFKLICAGLNINNPECLFSRKNFEKKIVNFINSKKKMFLEIKISNENSKNLPRPKNLIKIKNDFMN